MSRGKRRKLPILRHYHVSNFRLDMYGCDPSGCVWAKSQNEAVKCFREKHGPGSYRATNVQWLGCNSHEFVIE